MRACVCACACDCERKRDRGVHTTIQLPPTSPPFSVESSVILDGKGKEKVEVYNDAAERKGGGGRKSRRRGGLEERLELVGFLVSPLFWWDIF